MVNRNLWRCHGVVAAAGGRTGHGVGTASWCGYHVLVWALHPSTAPSVLGAHPGSGWEIDAAEC